jgi:hypothetical protein
MMAEAAEPVSARRCGDVSFPQDLGISLWMIAWIVAEVDDPQRKSPAARLLGSGALFDG